MDLANPSQKLIARPVVPMFKDRDPETEQVSQALLAMPVAVIERAGDWRLIRTPDEYQGWVTAADLADPPAGWRAPWMEVEDLWINLRARPDSRLAAATQAIVGARLPLADEEEDWVRLLVPDGRVLWVERQRVRPVTAEPLRPAAPREVCRTARRLLGVPYLWGGGSPLGIDCSGLVQLVMRLHGVSLLRDSYLQAEQGEPVAEPDTADLVFFGAQPEKITHVGMMLNRRRFIHAAGGDRVRINRITDEPYGRQFRRARRFLAR